VPDRSADHRWAIGLQMVGRAHIEVNVIAGLVVCRLPH
jgi:hypothetical protein